MNQFLDARFSERVDRLMLGIEAVDAMRAERIGQVIDVALDGVPGAGAAGGLPRDKEMLWDTVFGFPDSIGALTRLARHDSCRHALLFKPGMQSPVTVRLFDRQRRFVPRRLRYPVPADITTPTPRVRRPALFPGAAYPVSTDEMLANVLTLEAINRSVALSKK